MSTDEPYYHITKREKREARQDRAALAALLLSFHGALRNPPKPKAPKTITQHDHDRIQRAAERRARRAARKNP